MKTQGGPPTIRATPGTIKDDPLTSSNVAEAFERFSRTFEASAKRWELVVYPTLFAFIILAIYGFYLIYSLTSDVSRVAHDMHLITENVGEIATGMGNVSGNMRLVSDDLQAVSRDMDSQLNALNQLVVQMNAMNQSVFQVSSAVSTIRNDMGMLNHSVSRPATLVNRIMPW